MTPTAILPPPAGWSRSCPSTCARASCEGYLKTGRHGLFPCYEAFIQIADSMIAQFAKWLKVAHEVDWRPPISSLNILLTSDAWRQDHNGYSHQNPASSTACSTRRARSCASPCRPTPTRWSRRSSAACASTGYINLVIATKQELPQWLSIDEARDHATAGASISALGQHRGGH